MNKTNKLALKLFFCQIFLVFHVFFCVSPVLAQSSNNDTSSQKETFERTITETLFDDSRSIFHRKILQTVFAVVFANILLFGLIAVVNRSVRDIKARYVFRKNLVYITSIITIIIIFFVWIQNLSSITIFLGVASAGIALALQEVILSMAGWVLILMRRPFEIGDRIELNSVKGDVIDIRLFQTSLLEIGNWIDADQSTGRIVNIPNSFIFKYQNYNYSRGFEFIWHEIPVLVTFESDWKVAKEIMMKHANKIAEGMEAAVQRKIDVMKNRYMIYYGKLTPIVYVSIKDSGVLLTLRYLTEAKKRRWMEDSLSQAILTDFEENDRVNFAYPTYRIVKE